MRIAKIWPLALTAAVVVAACSEKTATPPLTPTPVVVTLTAPALETPTDDQQLDTLRPALTVRNGTSSQTSGTRTYEFQIADNTAFSPVAVTATTVAEDAGGKTSFTPTADLAPTTRLYWRVRLTQGTTTSDWSSTGKFKTRLVGFNRNGELYDPLVLGETVGTRIGSTTFVAGKGIRLNDNRSYVQYLLSQSAPSGEFSMEVEGLRADGPCCKPKIFQMMDGEGHPGHSENMINAQYRGSTPPGGNPNNAIAFKAVLGGFDHDEIVEPDLGTRNQSILIPDPSKTYFWQGIWTPNSFRLVVKDGSSTGATLYDYTMTAPGGHFSPSPHFASLGSQYENYVADTGTFPGMIVRNVWLSSKSRPATLGNALRPQQ